LEVVVAMATAMARQWQWPEHLWEAAQASASTRAAMQQYPQHLLPHYAALVVAHDMSKAATTQALYYHCI